MAKVSVIIPCYNYGRYLMFAVESVIHDVADVEVIVVNDGSTDNTNEITNVICCPFKFPEKTIKYIKCIENRGVSVARNVGLKSSTGDYITFLDADDMRTPASLAIQKLYLDTHNKVDVVYGYALEIRGDIDYVGALAKFKSLRKHPAKVNPQTVMYRRGVFEKYGGWYEGLRSGEDKEMSMRLGVHPESPFKLVKAKKMDLACAFYRKHPLEKHKMRKADLAWDKRVKKVQKRRIAEIKKHGITRDNTEFPI